jgi:beta-N-acetylhexosaminidase
MNGKTTRRMFVKALTLTAASFFSPSMLRVNAADSASRSTLKQKIARMIMIGFRGTYLKADDAIVRDIREYGIGGVILFDYDVLLKSYGRNIVSPSQLKALTAQLRSYAQGRPLFIAVDQEGGRVCRLKEQDGFSKTVSAKYLGDKNDLKVTRRYSQAIASMLADNGLNVNFAPVVDLNINPGNPVIGKLERSFSADPAIVTKHAREFIQAHESQKVLTSLKHFPGHGSSTTDSHRGFVDVTDTWSEIELKPFKNLINDGNARMVMTAHIFNRNLDPDYPATLSYKTLTGLLRKKLGFGGVIISDDLQMGAITLNYSFETAVEKSIVAGNDILLLPNNNKYDPDIVPKTIELVSGLVDSGIISTRQIDESFNRIAILSRVYA